MEDYIKCELIDGGSLRHSNTFSNLFIVAVHYISTHAMYCAIIDCTHVHHVVHYEIFTTYHILLLLFDAPMWAQLQLPSGTW